MVRVAFNGPKVLMREFDLGDFSYALAHECLAHSQEVEYYKKMVESGRTVFLDNGADELGTGMSGSDLMRLTREIKPSVLILPDVLHEQDQTVKASLEFFDKYGDEVQSLGTTVMFVVQAADISEVFVGLKIAEYMTQYTGGVIGVPYDLGHSHNYRSIFMSHWARPAHLLGMTTFEEFRHYSQYGEGVTHDTTAPYAAAQAGVRFKLPREEGYPTLKKWPRLKHDDGEINRDLLMWNLLVYLWHIDGGMDALTRNRPEVIEYLSENNYLDLVAAVEADEENSDFFQLA